MGGRDTSQSLLSVRDEELRTFYFVKRRTSKLHHMYFLFSLFFDGRTQRTVHCFFSEGRIGLTLPIIYVFLQK